MHVLVNTVIIYNFDTTGTQEREDSPGTATRQDAGSHVAHLGQAGRVQAGWATPAGRDEAWPLPAL